MARPTLISTLSFVGTNVKQDGLVDSYLSGNFDYKQLFGQLASESKQDTEEIKDKNTAKRKAQELNEINQDTAVERPEGPAVNKQCEGEGDSEGDGDGEGQGTVERLEKEIVHIICLWLVFWVVVTVKLVRVCFVSMPSFLVKSITSFGTVEIFANTCDSLNAGSSK